MDFLPRMYYEKPHYLVLEQFCLYFLCEVSVSTKHNKQYAGKLLYFDSPSYTFTLL